MEAFKTIKGLNGVIKEDWFQIDEADSTRPSTRSNSNVTGSGSNERNSNVVLHERAKTEIRNQSYRLRTARAWNDLPQGVRDATTTNAFKNLYDKWLSESLNNNQTES